MGSDEPVPAGGKAERGPNPQHRSFDAAEVVDAGLVQRLADVRGRIADAAAGREVRIVAVTKTFPVAVTEQARRVGLMDVGENYARDLVDKYNHPTVAVINRGLRWHFIGGLQSNKIKALGSRVWLWQTVDRPKLVEGLAARVPGARILVQVNATGEPQKSGCRPGDVSELVELARQRGLQVLGLMAVGPTDGSDPRPAFSLTRELADRLDLVELSMGMSGDFELAVTEGATMVRIGSSLFGPRPPADSA